MDMQVDTQAETNMDAKLDTKLDTKAFKRSLNNSDNYHRRGFGHVNEAMDAMNAEYQSDLIREIRDNNYVLKRGNVTIHLAQSYLPTSAIPESTD